MWMNSDTFLTKEVLDKLKEKGPQTVPLMFHGQNESIQIGEATVEVDNKGLHVVSTKITDSQFSWILDGDIGEISFGPTELRDNVHE